MRGIPARHEPDPALIQRAQEGDRTSLRQLLEEVSVPVRGWALAQTGDPDEAADLAQEVLVLLLRKLSSFRGEARFLTWLFTVTRNQAMEAGRSRGRHRKKMERFKAEVGWRGSAPAQGGEGIDHKRIGALVTSFLEELPPRQREVFQLSDLEGMGSPEISRILGVEPVAVRAALFKARRTLRRLILEQHPEVVEEYLS